MSVRQVAFVWSFVLIILTCTIAVDAAKASSRRTGGSAKKTPNYDHVALSYGSHRNHQPVQHQHQQHQVHQTQTHQSHAPSAPSAPALPSANTNNNKPVGWNVPHTETVNQPKTATNTHSAMPYPQNPPPYQPNTGFNPHSAGAPPPYSANPNFNSHAPAGPPPPYSQNPNPAFNQHAPVGQPPAYQPAPSYPAHNAPNAGYPQQSFNGNPSGVYPNAGVAPSYVPQGQQVPVINNHFYGQPGQTGGSSGGGGTSLLGTALAAGAGAVAGNALYGALKPDHEQKTVIIHENANAPASAVPPAIAPAPLPVVPADQTTVQPMMQPSASVPIAPQDTGVRSDIGSMIPPLAPTVPLAPLPDASMQPTSVSMAPMPDSNTMQTGATMSDTTLTAVPSIVTTTTTTTSAPASEQSSVPLAPFPSDSSAQAQKGSASSFVIFNVSVYTIISILIASIF